MIRQLLGAAWQFIIAHWGLLAPFIFYLLGSIVTRKIMAPEFCPNCLRRNLWIEELKKEGKKDGSSKPSF